MKATQSQRLRMFVIQRARWMNYVDLHGDTNSVLSKGVAPISLSKQHFAS